LIAGRRTFDDANGWGGTHPMGVPTFVVTHSIPDGWPLPDSSVMFVTDGIASALAQAKKTAGDKVPLTRPGVPRRVVSRTGRKVE
jgi:dihydrofolate reductase